MSGDWKDTADGFLGGNNGESRKRLWLRREVEWGKEHLDRARAEGVVSLFDFCIENNHHEPPIAAMKDHPMVVAAVDIKVHKFSVCVVCLIVVIWL